MALIVEDGSGKTDAESFCSVAAADSYHAKMGNIAWADLDADVKEQCLRRATQYMQGAYRLRWLGTLTKYNQALAWPRFDVRFDGLNWPIDQVPPEVIHACALLALKASTEALAPDIEREVIAESVGSIAVTYKSGAPAYKRYREVDMLLAHLLAASTNTIALGRA